MQISTREINDESIMSLAALTGGGGRKDGVVTAIQSVKSQINKALEVADNVNEVFRLQGASQVCTELERLINEAPAEVENRRKERR